MVFTHLLSSGRAWTSLAISQHTGHVLASPSRYTNLTSMRSLLTNIIQPIHCNRWVYSSLSSCFKTMKTGVDLSKNPKARITGEHLFHVELKKIKLDMLMYELCLNNHSRYEDCNSKLIPKALDGKPVIEYNQTCRKRSSPRGISCWYQWRHLFIFVRKERICVWTMGYMKATEDLQNYW